MCFVNNLTIVELYLLAKKINVIIYKCVNKVFYV